MDPLSLTTLQKSFNMAVLFQPSIVLKPNPPSSFGLHWTSWSYGSYRWVRGLTKRNPECSMKWISRSSPEAWKRTTNRCEGLQALRRWAPFMTAAFFSNSNCKFFYFSCPRGEDSRSVSIKPQPPLKKLDGDPLIITANDTMEIHYIIYLT